MTVLILVVQVLFELLHFSQPTISHRAENSEQLQCPVDGAWTLWTVWSACEGECGGVGHQLRTRNCSMPHHTDQREIRPCAVPGCSYEQYEKLLSQNSVRLQQLKMLKQLSSSKTALLTKCVTSNCEFKTVLDELEKSAIKFWNALQCVKKDIGCPVAGGWSDWSAWSRCSARCGEGSQLRCRVCCNPPPTSTERNCPGDNCQYQPCTASECGDTRRDETSWSSWSLWSPCSASCGFGIKRRSRTCSKDSNSSSKKSNLVHETPSESSSNDFDYYGDYAFDYGLDEKFEQYKANMPEEEYSESRQEIRNKRSCKANIEYYSTAENDDDYTNQFDTTSKASHSSRFTTVEDSSITKNEKYSTGNNDDVDSLDDTTKLSAKLDDSGEESGSSKIEYYSTEIDEDEDYLTTVHKTSKLSLHPEIKTKETTISQSVSETKHSSTDNLEGVEPEITTQLKIRQGSCKTKVEYYSTESSEDYSSLIETSLNLPHKSTVIISSSKKQIQTTTLYTTESISIKTVPSTTFESPSSKTNVKIKSSTVESVEQKKTKHKMSKLSSTLKSTTSLSDYDYSDLDENRAKGSGDKVSVNKFKITSDDKVHHSTLPCRSKTISKFTQKPKWVAENILPYQEGFHMVIDDDNPGTTTMKVCKDQLFEYPINNLNDNLSTNLAEKSEEYIDLETAQGGGEEDLYESKLDSTTSSECVECVTIKPEQDLNCIESTNSQMTEQVTERETLDEKTSKKETTLKVEETKTTLKSDLVSNRHSTSTPKLLSRESSITPSSSILTSFTGSSQVVSSTTSLTSLLNLNQDNSITTSDLNKTIGNILSSQSFEQFVRTDELTTSRAVTMTVDEDDQHGNITEESSSSNCDLGKLLHLPNFNDSFKVEGCRGPFEEIKSCNDNPCKVSGGWSSWSAWSPCIPECGIGKQTSTRSCTNPEPGDKGSSCAGETSRKRFCFLKPCTVQVSSLRALLMSGDSVIKYEPLRRHFSMFMTYLRFRHYNCSGELISRRSGECKSCDVVSLALINCYVLVFIRQKSCYTHFSTVGDWHEILLTVEGSVVSLRLDDSAQVQQVRLSCRPKAPNYDSAMKIGGRFIGEVDHLTVNFKRYALQKKHAKRSTPSESDSEVEPSESSQVQAKLNNEELPTLNLAQFIQAPCFSNSSAWQLKLAVKPEFSIGLVMFVRGYDESEFMVLTLEGEDVRLRVKMGARMGECERAVSVAPRTWLHIALTKPASALLGLAVNGNERCVVELDITNDNDGKDELQCSEILFGEMPLFVRMLMDTDGTRSAPVKSPLGELSSLAVDNRTLDLTRLPRKVPPDLTDTYPQTLYRLSSYSASSTVYFEEVLVLMKEPLSLLCVYDLSADEPHPKKGPKKQNLETEHSVSWLKLDIPVETYFNQSTSTVKYQISDDGKASTLNITEYTDAESVEGFYCCWLQYPLPQQPGLNIITYQVVVVTIDQDRPLWLIFKNNANLVFFIIILSICVIWMVCEAIIDQKKGSGFIRCKRLNEDEEYKKVHFLMFSDKGIKRLGRTSAVHRAHDQYLTHIKTKADKDEISPLVTSVENTETSGAESSVDYEATDHEVKIQIPDNRRFKKLQKGPTVVGYSLQNPSPKFQTNTGQNNMTVEMSPAKYSLSVEDLQDSDPEEFTSNRTNERRLSAGVGLSQVNSPGERSIYLKNYRTPVVKPNVEKIGNIQDTVAFRNIENDLKFIRGKYQELEKYWTNNKK